MRSAAPASVPQHVTLPHSPDPHHNPIAEFDRNHPISGLHIPVRGHHHRHKDWLTIINDVRHCLRRQGQQTLARLAATIRKLVGGQHMTACNNRNPHTRLKALRDNPGLHIIRSAPIASCSTDDLNLAVKTIRDIHHRRLLLINQDQTLCSTMTAKPQYPMGRSRRLLQNCQNTFSLGRRSSGV
jgi:hypothetical protein